MAEKERDMIGAFSSVPFQTSSNIASFARGRTHACACVCLPTSIQI